MISFSRICFPVAVLAFVSAELIDLDNSSNVGNSSYTIEVSGNAQKGSYDWTASKIGDTVIYPPYGFKANLSEEELQQTFEIDDIEDTLTFFDSAAVSKLSPRDSLKALLDSTLWDKIDSIYLADSIAKAKAEFEAWYASLEPKERRKYNNEQRIKLKMAQSDSIRNAKQKKKDERDSIIAEKPRILETYALPDSMFYKRIISWTTDQEFSRMSVSIPDTGYNYHFYDYPFLRNDVNASWLGVAGSPVQYYNYFKRKSDEGVEFYNAVESWSFSPRTIPNYNTKTPYTELAYFGPLLASRDKESDNIHILTTQNITPELNFSLLYDRFGGMGMLENEKTVNKTFAFQSNYLGKKYTMHAGYIYNMASRNENGGMQDITWIRDTTVESREINVFLNKASSKIKKNSIYLNQQLRIPFTFISKIRARRDSTFIFDPDNLDRNITTAFLGHSSEFSTYTRKYSDVISNDAGKEFYNNVFRYNPSSSADSMRVAKLDNKVYLRLQPWSDEAIVSKLDVGAGFLMQNYFDSTSLRPKNHIDNSFYIYGGAEGQLRNSFFWKADARLSLIGYDAGDFSIGAKGNYKFYPFRRARKSPIELNMSFETSLKQPNWYQQHISSNHFSWDNDFGKISTTSVQGSIAIPHWKINASVGYALLSGNLWYDTQGIIRRNSEPMSVLSADLRKEFVFGPVHLDNKALVQLSSNPSVLPLPALALNLRYFFEFVAQRSEDKRFNVLVMQIGVNAFYNTAWNSPSWNPNLGVFHNQTDRLYTNGPYFDVFVNMQWKRACIFVKYQNAGQGWPMNKHDYFSADRYIITQNGMPGLKLGIFWPFYAESRKGAVQSSSSFSSSSNINSSYSSPASGSSSSGRSSSANRRGGLRENIR